MTTDIDQFVEWFRASAPYIHAHRGRTFVIVFGGEVLESKELPKLLVDIALLHSLGIRLVLVAGARPQIDKGIARRGGEPKFIGDLRVTDKVALQAVKEAVGCARVELEALLSMGLPNSPMAGARLRVAAGNFVMARPVGIIDGVDFMHTGKPRRVDVDAIKQRLDNDAIVVLTPIGYSATGEAFNMSSYEVATATASALKADKLIGLVEGKGVVDARGKTISQLTPADAQAVINSKRKLGQDVRRQISAAVQACQGGVSRAHLVSRHTDGALLRELFTRDGIGTLVTGDMFEGIRPADRADVGGILQLIEPLEAEGVLVRRSKEMLENDVDRFTVIERDGMIIGCGAIYAYPEEKIAELACIVVHDNYRRSGRGDDLLDYLEKQCVESGLNKVFVLTTQTSHWFRERGFSKCDIRELPKARRRFYDANRRSRVLSKTLGMREETC